MSKLRNDRRIPSVAENLQRLAAEITGGVPGDRASVVWPKANGNGIPNFIGRENRKPIKLPKVLPPTRCHYLQDEMTSRISERKEVNISEQPRLGSDLENKASKNSVKPVSAKRRRPHLNSNGNLQPRSKTVTNPHGEKWLPVLVSVIGDDGALKRKRRKNGEPRWEEGYWISFLDCGGQ